MITARENWTGHTIRGDGLLKKRERRKDARKAAAKETKNQYVGGYERRTIRGDEEETREE